MMFIKFNDTKQRCLLIYYKTTFRAVIGLFMD